MKKNETAFSDYIGLRRNFLLKMKLTLIGLLITLIQVSATVYSQATKFSFELRDKQVAEVLKEIEENSNFRFFYQREQVDVERIISINSRENSVEEILTSIFKEEEIKYKVLDNDLILLTTENKSFSEVLSQLQQKKVTGTISDMDGLPLPGVTVNVKGTTTGTVSNSDGVYALDVPEDAILVFQFVGMHTQEIAIENKSEINVTMLAEMIAIDEVVAIGYGSMKKSDLTGSVGSVSSESLEQRHSINPVDALTGRIAGVRVFNGSGRPGGGMRVQIRGASSINASNDPLYVIDGVVGGDIGLINQNDIESIDILKDASATAIYGAQGSNGVVIVTTKKAAKGKVTLTYDGSVGVGVLAHKVDLLNSEQFMEMRHELYDDIRSYNPSQASYLLDYDGSMYPELWNSDGTAKFDTDWQDEATRVAISHRHHVTLSGSTKNFDGGTSIGYQKEEGILLNTWMEKTTARFFGNFKIKERIKVGGSINFGFTNENRPDQYGTGGMVPTRLMYEMPPIFPVQYADGRYSKMEDVLRKNGGWDFFIQYNPVTMLENEMDVNYKNYQVLGNFYVDLNLAKGLNLKSTYGRKIALSKNAFYFTRGYNTYTQMNSANLGDITQDNWQLENILTYDKTIKNQKINAMLGASWYEYGQFSFAANASNFADEYYGINNIGVGTNPPTVGSSYTASKLNSYFARVNYNYADKYFATATLRYDGSSRFGANNSYATFPSVAFAWRASEEEFLKDNSIITNLKLRLSYGQTGNNAIGDYTALGSPGVQTVIFDKQKAIGSSQGVMPNSDLKWEKTTETNLGVDLQLIDRINLSVDYYNRETTDLLFAKPVAQFTGYSSVLSNIGSVQNKGIELSLVTNNINNSNFSWDTQLTFNKNVNKVLALGSNDEDVFSGFWFSHQIFRVGEPIGSYWGNRRLTTWGTDEADEAAKYGRVPGDPRVEDVNNDGKYDKADQMILGSPYPDYEIGFINDFTYKSWDLSVDIHISQGADILNVGVMVINDRYNYANAYTEMYEGRWTTSNQNTMWSRVKPDLRQFSSFDSGHIFDGSFIRGRNLSLGYNLPKAITQKLNIANVKFYANVQNFFLITNYFGADPEVSSQDGNQWAQGFDVYGYPKPRTFNFGVKLSL